MKPSTESQSLGQGISTSVSLLVALYIQKLLFSV